MAIIQCNPGNSEKNTMPESSILGSQAEQPLITGDTVTIGRLGLALENFKTETGRYVADFKVAFNQTHLDYFTEKLNAYVSETYGVETKLSNQDVIDMIYLNLDPTSPNDGEGSVTAIYLMNQYKNKNFSFYAGMLQTSFFPIISMGPITRTDDFSAKIKYDYEKVIQKLMIGLIMLILGEYFGLYVLININETHSALEFWISAVSNSFYIYLVFAGYSNLIIGLGLLVGIKLPENFNSPYLSTSITEFWRKWHISLSFWIRDYLYITLGGNRKGILRKIINIIVAMILCGLWHGISLNFLLWGLYHGILLGIESLMVSYNFFPIKNYFPRIHRIIKTFIVFFLVTISWILFTYNIQDSMIHIKGLFIW